jgi:hypothetical protein
METETRESVDELFNPASIEGKKGMKVLPDLDGNIKCGNSLIDKDFYFFEGIWELKVKSEELRVKEKSNIETAKAAIPVYSNKPFAFADNETIKKVNPFSWEETFPDIMKSGGFDCIVGNPPYGAELSHMEINYFDDKYSLGIHDTYDIFIIKAINSLLKHTGFCSLIVPRYLQFNRNAEIIRKTLLKTGLLSLTEVGMCFEDAKTECIIFVCKKNSYENKIISNFYYPNENLILNAEIDRDFFYELPNAIFNVFISKSEFSVLSKILKNEFTLAGEKPIGNLKRGMESYKANIANKNRGIRTIVGGELSEYFDNQKENCFINKKYKEIARLEHINNKIKILIRRVANKLIANIDYKKRAFTKNLYAFYDSLYDLTFILGLLNSKLLSFFLKKYFTTRKDDIFPEIVSYQLEQLPIPKIDGREKEVAQIIKLVNLMIEIQKELHLAQNPKDKEIYQTEADMLEKEIDAIVYDLYGLTEKEIAVIEAI